MSNLRAGEAEASGTLHLKPAWSTEFQHGQGDTETWFEREEKDRQTDRQTETERERVSG
jgi:hypothetical protein